MSVLLVVGADDELGERLAALTGHRVVALEAAAVEMESISLLRGIKASLLPRTIIFTQDLPLPRSMRLADEVHAVRPEIDIILVANPDPQVVLDAMRVGIRDVTASLDDPIFLAGLRDRLDKQTTSKTMAVVANVEPTRADFTSRVITVASAKGGVGKTSISTNLGVALAKASPMEVVLVDLDLQFGDLSATLDLRPSHTLTDAFQSASQDNLLLKTFLTVHPAGFYVLCGADSPAANDKVTAIQIRHLLKQLQDQFTYVIVDTGAGLQDSTLAALEETDDLVLVSTMDVACVRGVRKEIDLLIELGLLPLSCHFVLNLADKASGMRVKDVEAAAGTPVDIILPRSRKVLMSSNIGVPILLNKRAGPFAKSINLLAKRINDRAQASGETQTHRRMEIA